MVVFWHPQKSPVELPTIPTVDTFHSSKASPFYYLRPLYLLQQSMVFSSGKKKSFHNTLFFLSLVILSSSPNVLSIGYMDSSNLGQCPLELRICFSCPRWRGTIGVGKPNPPAIEREAFDEVMWLRTLECPQCASEWFVCTTCSSSRSHMKDLPSLRKHVKRCHSGA